VTEDQLRAIFQRFGEIVYVKIPAGKGCGFVQFMGRPNAEAAMLAMNGQVHLITEQPLRAAVQLVYCSVECSDVSVDSSSILQVTQLTCK
jgi:RNA recognition motif-containing protein